VTRRSRAERRFGLSGGEFTPASLPPLPAQRAAALALAALLAAACGVQGPPQPPRAEQPAAVRDFAAIQRGKNFVFTFTLPTLATDGERLTKPLEVEIFRVITPRGGTAPSSPPAAPPWKTFLDKDLGPQPRTPSATLPVAIPDAELGRFTDATWTFYLRTLTHGFRRRPVLSDWSNAVSEILQNVSEPLGSLQIETTEKALVLRWTPSAQGITAGTSPAPSGYSVFRSLSGKPGTFELLIETPAPIYLDPNFQFGAPYYYFVRAIFKQDSSRAESDDSPIAEITPRDTFPPRAPSGLTAVFAGGTVDLIWNANTETDLAGYNLERRGEGGDFAKLNPTLLPTPIFRDPTVEPGKKYFYRVRAVDRAGNISAPSEEVEAEAR
jgi:hypothetical protein